jgi:cytochrome c
MKRLNYPAICAGVLLAAVASANLHPFGNPRGNSEQEHPVPLSGVPIRDAAKRVLMAKCSDCHSRTTKWPIYSNIAPVSWLIERDVTRGREHLNFSEWQAFSPDRQQVLAQEIVQQARRGAMPPLPYRLLHWHARLTSADVATLVTIAPEVVEDGSAKPGDAQRGKAVFERRCTGCHALDSNREGPHLRGVYGRKAGSVPDFEYSAAIKESGLIWDEANLERWLRDTDEMVPDSKMGFRVPKSQDRADIIAFLKAVR